MDDFEELKEGESVLQHLIAGAAAGTAEHCALFPIDTIKTNMQAYKPNGSSPALSVYKTTISIMKPHGFIGLWRGVSAMAAGAAPAHAMHFATYEFCKKRFGGNREGHHPIITGAAGICATIVSDAILTPMDAVKQRMQLGAREYKGMMDCLKTIVAHEGVSALYASYTTTLLMNIPYVAIYFASYESLRKVLKRGSEREFDPIAHCFAGGGAGMLAAALTNPFDVAKTRLQTQGDVGDRKYKGMVNTMLTIWREERVTGYSRGLAPRVALHSTSAAICWLTYEWMKYILAKVGIGA